MALQSSGQISLQDIQDEFGGSHPISLSEYYGVDTVPASGEISCNDFYGTSNATYIVASGGTVTTSGNYKIHKFSGNGTFTVSSVGNAAGGGTTVEYLVVAGGGGAGSSTHSGGGGGGGYRTATGFNITTQSYSITIGAGGSGNSQGSNSIFSTITNTGGGYGGRADFVGGSGGSGGGWATFISWHCFPFSCLGSRVIG